MGGEYPNALKEMLYLDKWTFIKSLQALKCQALFMRQDGEKGVGWENVVESRLYLETLLDGVVNPPDLQIEFIRYRAVLCFLLNSF